LFFSFFPREHKAVQIVFGFWPSENTSTTPGTTPLRCVAIPPGAWGGCLLWGMSLLGTPPFPVPYHCAHPLPPPKISSLSFKQNHTTIQHNNFFFSFFVFSFFFSPFFVFSLEPLQDVPFCPDRAFNSSSDTAPFLK